MRRFAVPLIILLVTVGLVAAAWWYVGSHPEWRDWLSEQLDQAVEELGLAAGSESEALMASGFIEAEEAAVMTEIGGRILAINADEGDEVVAGDVLVHLDDTLLEAQAAIAEADLALAEAQLALVRAGARSERLEYAEAVVGQAVAAQEATLIAWEDAVALLENPQEQKLALLAARSQLGVMDQHEQQAHELANAGQAGRDFAEEAYRLLAEFELPVPGNLLDQARYEQTTATYQSWLAWIGLEEVGVARAWAETTLDLMEEQLANPLALQSQVNEARAQYQVASAAVEVAQAQLDGLKLGATPEQVAAAEAQVATAQAAVDALYVQADSLELDAPISGLVLERPVQAGELALPGARLMTLADLENVALTVYVPENRLGELQIGQPVSVTVDAYPGRVFLGTLRHIASQAEFTPKNVQTRDERVNMVFAVKVVLPNPDHALKPGMPADAVLSPQREP